ncbi:uncharacterized protein BDW47DRAFT_128834 [Aspergillus candidus]|uniref:CRIB domain-containing protein n=1 Tax=Aspergillus candidus TaxID=41067 RepID=A0A2I2F265_ASPCN|nr:hypothetical protein BDW47DRAFT_128834 [Aspergillus candidus]PLB34707.1 hypothetical protein BDW47DRAFT_128834 [Aspergillus candidus]
MYSHRDQVRSDQARVEDRPSTRSSNGDPPDHAVHLRSRSTALPHSPKRLSVFGGRSRSNTTTTSSSSITTTTTSTSNSGSTTGSTTSSMTSVDAASVHPPDDRAPSAAGLRNDRPGSMTKALFTRGSRILRRQGSRFHIVATLDEVDESDRDRRASSARFEVGDLFHRHHRARQSDAQGHLKSLISDPFDFHHLTHTSQSHFPALEDTRQNDLVTEFSAIRASQRPVTDLKGIRAEDILPLREFADSDSSPLPPTTPTAPVEDPLASVSPSVSPGGSSSISPKQQVSHARRPSRPIENFSRPVPRSPRVDSPPPRAASPHLAAAPDIPEPTARVIDEILHRPPPAAPSGPELAGSWDHVRTMSLSPTTRPSDLTDVPEEIAATHWHDSPEQPDLADGPRPPSRGGSSPVPASRPSIYSSAELSRRFSEALGSPTLPPPPPSSHMQRGASEADDLTPPSGAPIRRGSSRRKPAYETIYETWDADIDYCYEHAAESCSDFDWGRRSLEERPPLPTPGSDIPILATDCDGPVPSSAPRGVPTVPAMHLSPSTLPTPGSQRALTPASAAGDYFPPVGPSLFPSALGKPDGPDALYEEYLATDAESDRPFSFYSSGVSPQMEHPVSPRSSFSPISKYNSEESLILSRAASIVRKHRSSVSTVSVPDLIHSLANSRDLADGPPSAGGDSSSRCPSAASAARPEASTHHRPTKSLAGELDSWCRDPSSGDAPRDASGASALHDRAQSTSHLETAPWVARAKPDLPPKSAHRRRGRPSYSLFPTAPPN